MSHGAPADVCPLPRLRANAGAYHAAPPPNCGATHPPSSSHLQLLQRGGAHHLVGTTATATAAATTLRRGGRRVWQQQELRDPRCVVPTPVAPVAPCVYRPVPVSVCVRRNRRCSVSAHTSTTSTLTRPLHLRRGACMRSRRSRLTTADGAATYSSAYSQIGHTAGMAVGCADWDCDLCVTPISLCRPCRVCRCWTITRGPPPWYNAAADGGGAGAQ